LLAITLQNAYAQDSGYKIGFVNTSRVLKEAPQARKVEEELKAEFEPREAQLRQKRQEILDLEDQLKTDTSLTSNSRRKLEREIRLKVSQLKFLEQEFREDQNLRRNEEIRALQQVISNVLKMQGDAGKFDLILTEGVSYVSEQIDITAETIEMLKQLAESSEGAQ
jgi:outer membrane protein